METRVILPQLGETVESQEYEEDIEYIKSWI